MDYKFQGVQQRRQVHGYGCKVEIAWLPEEDPPFATAEFFSPGSGGFMTRKRSTTAYSPDTTGAEELEGYLDTDYPENVGA